MRIRDEAESINKKNMGIKVKSFLPSNLNTNNKKNPESLLDPGEIKIK